MSTIHASDHSSGIEKAPNAGHDKVLEPQKEEPVHLSKLAEIVVKAFEKKEQQKAERNINVNPVVSKFASWYEKLRNAMEYREDEVILRATIERILRRRLLLGGNAKTTAGPLIRELIWAQYLPDDTVGESMVEKVEEVIDLYLTLRLAILQQHNFSDHVMNQWTYDLMSAHIEQVLHPNNQSQVIANFMFQLLKNSVQIADDTEQTRDAQVYLAIRKAFAHDDRAFLRFHMFIQIFGMVKKDTVSHIAQNFPAGFKEITKQLEYRKKDVIYGYVKKQTAPFLILEHVLRGHKDDLEVFVTGDTFKTSVYTTCTNLYHGIADKVTRAIIRSVIFIFLTKLVFAFLIEGTYEHVFYGEIQWGSLALNTGIPPILMIFVGLMIKTPDASNTDKVYAYIRTILTQDHPQFGQTLMIKKAEDQGRLRDILGGIWVLAFMLSFGSIIYVLYLLHFNMISMLIFVFFLAIVSFLAYRISLTASMYRLGEKQGIFTPIIDFLFVPIIRVGRQLTEGISQINILIFLFDFLIETPFKELFGFFEQLFHFLHTKRDELG